MTQRRFRAYGPLFLAVVASLVIHLSDNLSYAKSGGQRDLISTYCAGNVPLQPFADKKAFKVLILQFAGIGSNAEEFGLKLGRRMQMALERYKHDQAHTQAWLDSGLSASTFQVAFARCPISTHQQARQLGSILRADLVLWGQVALETPPKISIEVHDSTKAGAKSTPPFLPKIANHVRVNNNGPGPTIVGNNTHVGQYFQDIHIAGIPNAVTGTLTPAITAVNSSLEIEAKTGIKLSDCQEIHQMDFPKLATEEPLVILHLMLGFYANQNGRFQLATYYFDQAKGDENAFLDANSYSVLGRAYIRAGVPQRGMNLLRKATQSFPSGSICESVALGHVAWGYYRTGQRKEALMIYGRMLENAKRAGDLTEEAHMLNNVGSVLLDTGKISDALQHFERSLSIIKKSKEGNRDRYWHSSVLYNTGRAYDELGEENRAFDFYKQALDILRKTDHWYMASTMLTAIGSTLLDLKSPQKALPYFEKAMSIARVSGDLAEQARIMDHIGRVHQQQGDHDKALELFEKALPLRHQASDTSGEAASLCHISELYIARRDLKKADSYLSKALGVTNGDALAEYNILNHLININRNFRQHQKTIEYLERFALLAHRTGIRRREATAYNNIGVTYNKLGEDRKTIEYLEKAARIWEDVGDHEEAAINLISLGGVYNQVGDRNNALRVLDRALSFAKEVHNVKEEARTLYHLGHVYAEQRNFSKALEAYEKVFQIKNKHNDNKGQAEALSAIGMVYTDQRQTQKAIEYYEKALSFDEDGVTLNNIGSEYLNLGQANKALSSFSKALDLLKKKNELYWLPTVLDHMGAAQEKLGHPVEAVSNYREAAIVLLRRTESNGALTELRRAYNVAERHKLSLERQKIVSELPQFGFTKEQLIDGHELIADP